MKGPSLLFAVVGAVGSGLFALFCLVAISIAGDSRPTNVVPYLYVAAVLAATFLAWRAVRFISRDEPDSARRDLTKYAVLAGIFLVIGLHSSHHSDGKVLAFGLVIETCAISAYALMPD